MSRFTKSVHDKLLTVGGMEGFETTLLGMGVGAAGGAANGSFSDYDGFFSGAVKGGLLGAGAGSGLKYVGSKYAKGHLADPTDGFKFSKYSKGTFSDNESWFDVVEGLPSAKP